MSLFARASIPDTLIVAGRTVPVAVTRRRGARGVRLRADGATGTIRIGLPARGGVREALALIASHHDWLAVQVAGWPRACPLAPGATIPFDGGDVRIDWQAGTRGIALCGDRLTIGGSEATVGPRLLRWLKAEALARLAPATHALAARIGRPVAQVRVADPRARWGSCAPAGPDGGRIAYSWRLVLAPDWVREAVVAHEVAHLVHAHHGPDFHRLADSLHPRHAEARVWLRRHGAALHRVGRD